MFPVTHVYFHSLMFPSSTAGVIGAAYPDTMFLTGLKWNDTHKSTVELFEALSPEEKQEHAAFLKGVLSHAVDSEGLDYHGDEKYRQHDKGYAFIKAEPIIPSVVKACRIPEKLGLWKAHNFVEMGIETMIAKNNPHLREWIEASRKDTETIRKISRFLAQWYPVEEKILEKGITDFFNFMIASGDPIELGRSYKCVLGIRHGITNPDPAEIAEVIEKAADMVRDEYTDFLTECRKAFEKRWRGILFEG